MGIDVRLDPLQQIANDSDASLFGGAGRVSMVSLDGTLLASDDADKPVGQPFSSQYVSANLLTDLLYGGEAQTNWSEDSQWLIVFAPLTIANQTWGVIFEMPRSAVLADAVTLDEMISQKVSEGIKFELLVGLSLVILGLLTVAFAASRLVQPIKSVAMRLEDIASGEEISLSVSK